jgi:hypothetical protein
MLGRLTALVAPNPEWLNPSSGGIKPNYALTITPDRQYGADQGGLRFVALLPAL